jgi:hypothetical protein
VAALSPSQLAALVRAHFPAAARVTAYAIARAESGGRPDAVGDQGNSFGLWQIDRVFHPQYGVSWLLNPDNNAIAAAAISGGGTNWNPWCTWEASACGGRGNDRYRTYLAEATAALAISPPPSSPGPDPAPATIAAPSAGAWLALAGGGLLLWWAARRPASAAR